MRARFPARALLAALTLLGLASRGAGSLSPTLTSDDPMRLDLELNVTRAGDVAVLLWEDTYEAGVLCGSNFMSGGMQCFDTKTCSGPT